MTGNSKKLTLDRIYSSPSLSGINISQLDWSPDSRLLTYHCSDGEIDQIWAYDVESRTKTNLCAISKHVEEDPAPQRKRSFYTAAETELLADPDREYRPWRIRLLELGVTNILNYEWRPTGGQLLLASSFYGPYILFDVATGQASPSLPIPAAAEDVHFSPDGRRVSYMLEYNLYMLDLLTWQTVPLTRNGTEAVRFATGHTYGDFLSQGYWWSPDSLRIACIVSDVSDVRPMFVQDLTAPSLSFLWHERFAQPGQNVPLTSLFVLSPTGTTWIQTGNWAGWYLADVTWLPDCRRLALQFLNRDQNRLVLVIADSFTGQCYPILEESDPAWINLSGDLTFARRGAYFFWTSERDSFRHIYVYGIDGQLMGQLTSGDCACVQIKGIDEENRSVYFKAFPEPYVDGHLMRVCYDSLLKGGQTPPPERVTRLSGDHPVVLSPDHNYFADLYQTAVLPPRLDVFTCNGEFVETVHDNPVTELRSYLRPVEFFQIKAAKVGDPSDDLPLCARLIRPLNMEKGRKYPALVYVYGGPATGATSRTVVNKWFPVPDLWLHMMAQEGYVVFSLDNRGACAAPRGHAFETPIHKQLGVVELADQLAGIQYLKTLPFVDPSRLGIVGGSFGGFMVLNAMLRAPEVFKLGVAVAPVTNWTGYDNIYTEHFMKLPAQNPDGYQRTQLPPLAGNLQGKLLLVHGTADINVHLHHSFNMVHQILESGKQCELMVYPGKGHAVFFEISPEGKRIFTQIIDFLRRNM